MNITQRYLKTAMLHPCTLVAGLFLREIDKLLPYKNGEEVKYGAPDSVRPGDTIESQTVEVKNYSIEVANDSRQLAMNVAQQAQERTDHLPSDMPQTLAVDVTDQNIFLNDEESFVNDIVLCSIGTLQPSDVAVRRN